MEYQMPEKCPVCSGRLHVTELRCDNCHTVIRGDFALSPFARLNEPQRNFAMVFLKDGGNIKAVEKDLGISYPTVKKMLDETVSALGLPSKDIVLEQDDSREAVLSDLKQGTIDFDEAERRLARLGEKA